MSRTLDKPFVRQKPMPSEGVAARACVVHSKVTLCVFFCAYHALRSGFARYGDVLTDADGLPLVYDSDSIGRYWDKRPGEVGCW